MIPSLIDVSIIIINYNTFDFTVACIDSVFQFTKGCTFEIILIDNNSSEITPNSFKELFTDIKFLSLQDNVGFSKANNIGINHSTGKYILLLNSDTVLQNDSISICYKNMLNDSRIGVIGPRLINSDGSFQISTKCFPSIFKELIIIFKLYLFFPFYKYNVEFGRIEPVQDFDCDYLIGAFFMFCKNDLSFFPGNKLHDDFFMYVEDIQWCYFFKYKLRKSIRFSSQALVLHHGSMSSSKEYNRNKFYKVILPNIYKFVLMNKGAIYLNIYKFFLKIRFYLSNI